MRTLWNTVIWGAISVVALAAVGVACGEEGAGAEGSNAAPPAPRKVMTPTVARERPRPMAVMRGAARPSPAVRGTAAQFAVDPKLDLKVKWGRMAGRRWRRVSYRGADGDRVTALFRRVRARGKYPAIILGHGHGGDCRSMTQFFGESFKHQRVHLLAIDHPYHGHGRKVRGQDICARTPHALVKRFTRGVRDLRHAVRVLRADPRIDPERIGYLGFSLGGVLGGLLASHEPKLRAAALISPAGDWSVLARSKCLWKVGWKTRLLPKWIAEPKLRRLLATIDPAQSIRRFAPRPILFVVGRRDRVIHPDSGMALARAAGKGAETWKHVGGHGPGRQLRRRVALWLAEKLHK